MVGISELKIMNYTTIALLDELKQSSKRNRIIEKILKDEACFFKMNKNDAYAILEQIGVEKNSLLKVYNGLVSEQSYYNLKNNGKLKDEECVIYNNLSSDIFKNRQDEIDNQNKQDVQMVIYKESKLQKILNKLKSIFKKNK